MKIKICLFNIMIIPLMICSHLMANNNSYHSLQLGFLYDKNINKNSFHDYWNHKWGLDIFAVTPFYRGEIQAGVTISSYEKKNKQLVNFNTYFLYFGWGIKWQLAKKFQAFTFINLGNTIMKFYSPEKKLDYIYDLEEELSLRVDCGFNVPFYKNFYYRISVSYLTIYLYKKIELTLLSTGISYHFETPKWLIEFLK